VNRNPKEPIMQLKNATVLITGANRGIGLAFAREALARGARKVYAGARDPGAKEVLADPLTRQVKQGLSAEPASYLQA